ncbi:alanine-tRNA ligase [Actinidia rufa]|uniref:Alanine-tRNA ligase n=1 Tax=Actinidia rufa TaxID=165716 RepID=A0A7J0DJM1_9ERIC|nr:alanine-tRNA ligase [Actinidia rufa]
MAESSDEKPNTPLPSSSRSDLSEYSKSKISVGTTPWIDYAARQAQLAQKTAEETVDSAIAVTKSRVDRFLTTGSSHLHQTIDSLQDLKSEYDVYEDIVFGKIKEGVLVAASHPVASCSAAVGLGFLALKKEIEKGINGNNRKDWRKREREDVVSWYVDALGVWGPGQPWMMQNG